MKGKPLVNTSSQPSQGFTGSPPASMVPLIALSPGNRTDVVIPVGGRQSQKEREKFPHDFSKAERITL